MAIAVGERLPEMTFKVRTPEGIRDVTTQDLTVGKKVVLFAVPGAFTPTCSAKHLPSFRENKDALKAKGIDEIACTSVNDHFVMSAWAKDQGVAQDIKMLADGSSEFARAIAAGWRNAPPPPAMTCMPSPRRCRQ
mgnify:CR=1 FL=1